jgi:hypothetical protein
LQNLELQRKTGLKFSRLSSIIVTGLAIYALKGLVQVTLLLDFAGRRISTIVYFF